jgi:hypothetical protein
MMACRVIHTNEGRPEGGRFEIIETGSQQVTKELARKNLFSGERKKLRIV